MFSIPLCYFFSVVPGFDRMDIKFGDVSFIESLQ